MKKIAAIMLMTVVFAGALMAGETAREKRTQFSVGLNALCLSEHGDWRSVLGAAGLVIFNVGRRFMIVPEVGLGFSGLSAGCTFNVRLGRALFVGLGGVGGAFFGAENFDENPFSLVKIQAGVKLPRFIATLGYVNNLQRFYPAFSGFSLTLGYLF